MRRKRWHPSFLKKSFPYFGELFPPLQTKQKNMGKLFSLKMFSAQSEQSETDRQIDLKILKQANPNA